MFVVKIAFGDPKEDSCVFVDRILEGYVIFLLFVLMDSVIFYAAGGTLSLVGKELV